MTSYNNEIQLVKQKAAYNKRYSKCGVFVFVETFELFIYICAGRQLSNNLFPHLP